MVGFVIWLVGLIITIKAALEVRMHPGKRSYWLLYYQIVVLNS